VGVKLVSGVGEHLCGSKDLRAHFLHSGDHGNSDVGWEADAALNEELAHFLEIAICEGRTGRSRSSSLPIANQRSSFPSICSSRILSRCASSFRWAAREAGSITASPCRHRSQPDNHRAAASNSKRRDASGGLANKPLPSPSCVHESSQPHGRGSALWRWRDS
jgi:hypothetical protein